MDEFYRLQSSENKFSDLNAAILLSSNDFDAHRVTREAFFAQAFPISDAILAQDPSGLVLSHRTDLYEVDHLGKRGPETMLYFQRSNCPLIQVCNSVVEMRTLILQFARSNMDMNLVRSGLFPIRESIVSNPRNNEGILFDFRIKIFYHVIYF
jgi:hypothetical protein